MYLAGDIGDGRIMTALNADTARAAGRHLGRRPQAVDKSLTMSVAVMTVR